MMENRMKKEDMLLYHAHRWLYFSERLAEQYDAWFSSKEEDKNIENNIKYNNTKKNAV